jgi:hypothetical protein
MNAITGILRRTISLEAAMVAVLALSFAGNAWALYPPDGTKPNGPGAYQNPGDGMCVVGLKLDGTLLVDWSIKNARDCVAWTKSADSSVNLVGMTTSDMCTKTGFAGNDGYKHAWSTSLCYDVGNSKGISRVDLDNTDSMCFSKGGTVVTTGKCVAYGWIYLNRKADNTLPVTGTGLSTTHGVQSTDNLGFCATSMRMTSATYTSATTCPSKHNSRANADPVGGPYVEWPDCLSSLTGCQTQASYDAGLGWSFTSPNCLYTYGVTGVINAAATKADGTTYAAGSTQDLTAYTNQGDCLANGFSWDNWLPVSGTTIQTNASGGEYAGMPAGAAIRRLDALTNVEDGGGEFYSGTGAICQKCHSDQSRAYQERQKPGFPKTRHKLAGDAFGKPFQPNFTAAGSAWGLQGVQCAMCHSTAKPAQDDLIQIIPAGVVGPPGAGAPKSAAGHNNTEYGTHLLDICYTCHGTPATPSTVNPASVIPVAAGDFVNTAKGLAPIANEFLNSPHAKYAGSSTKVDVGDKSKYGSSFEGYVCRTGSGKLSSTTYPNAAACTGAGYVWYVTTSNGSFCYYDATSCAALPGGQWNTTFSAAAYPFAADTGGPGGVCAAVGVGSIITTVFRNGVAQKIHNLDSTTNTMCTNPGDGLASSGAAGFWLKDGETSPGGVPADTAQGNCMTCHDVHWALADTDPEAEPLRRECTSCHVNSGASASNAPQIDPTRINHLASTGTPLAHLATDPNESCETCHMPKSSANNSRMHLWRINTSSTYTTMGAGQVNTSADGTYTNAAWVDVDLACGQCHGGSGAAKPGVPYFTKGQLAIAARNIHQIVAPTNAPPVASETCDFNANTWTVTVTDTSTDDHNAIAQETVNWGDGSVVADDRSAPFGPFLHTYIGAGVYPITHKAIDDVGQLSAHGCTASPVYFSITGVVTNNYPGNTATVTGATVTVTNTVSGIIVDAVTSGVGGAYSVAFLKPGSYTVTATKYGYTFDAPTALSVGPSATVNLNSPAPALFGRRVPPLLNKLPSKTGTTLVK